MSSLIREDLIKNIEENAGDLEFPNPFLVDGALTLVEPRVMLAAFSLNESSGGYNNRPKYEPAYGPGGKYFNDLQSRLYDEYGELASSSLSSFQLMFVIFRELGFVYPPQQAADDVSALPTIIKYFNKRVFKNNEPNFLSMAGDAYNSGNWKDKNVPLDYINKLLKNYTKVLNSGIWQIEEKYTIQAWDGK
jgi:hypothetical protein